MLRTTQPWWWKETVLGKLGLMKRLSLFNIAKCVFFVLYLALLDETVISKGANIASSALSLYCLFYLPIHLNICCSVSGWGAHSGQGFHSSWFTTRPRSRHHRLQLSRVVLRRWKKDWLVSISSSLSPSDISIILVMTDEPATAAATDGRKPRPGPNKVIYWLRAYGKW